MDFRDNSQWTAKTLATRELVRKEAVPTPPAAPPPAPSPRDAELARIAADIDASVAQGDGAPDLARLLQLAWLAAGGAAGYMAWARENNVRVFGVFTNMARDRERIDRAAARPSQLVQVVVNSPVPGRPPSVFHVSAENAPTPPALPPSDDAPAA